MLTQLIFDLLPFPGGNRDHGADVLQKVMSKRLHVPETDSPGAIKRALNESGWVEGEVLAAGDVRQGKEPSAMSIVTGSALIEVLRRRLKALPRHFVLAVTDERVVAFNVIGTGDEFGDVYELWIRHEQIGSWPRSSVRMDDDMLEVEGERAPVFRAGKDPSTQELFAVLAG